MTPENARQFISMKTAAAEEDTRAHDRLRTVVGREDALSHLLAAHWTEADLALVGPDGVERPIYEEPRESLEGISHNAEKPQPGTPEYAEMLATINRSIALRNARFDRDVKAARVTPFTYAVRISDEAALAVRLGKLHALVSPRPLAWEEMTTAPRIGDDDLPGVYTENAWPVLAAKLAGQPVPSEGVFIYFTLPGTLPESLPEGVQVLKRGLVPLPPQGLWEGSPLAWISRGNYLWSSRLIDEGGYDELTAVTREPRSVLILDIREPTAVPADPEPDHRQQSAPKAKRKAVQP